MYDHHAPHPHHAIAAMPHGLVEMRIAPLVLQGRRRDGALEFVAALAVLCVLVAASTAYVRGKPVDPPARPAVNAAPIAATTAG